MSSISNHNSPVASRTASPAASHTASPVASRSASPVRASAADAVIDPKLDEAARHGRTAQENIEHAAADTAEAGKEAGQAAANIGSAGVEKGRKLADKGKENLTRAANVGADYSRAGVRKVKAGSEAAGGIFKDYVAKPAVAVAGTAYKYTVSPLINAGRGLANNIRGPVTPGLNLTGATPLAMVDNARPTTWYGRHSQGINTLLLGASAVILAASFFAPLVGAGVLALSVSQIAGLVFTLALADRVVARLSSPSVAGYETPESVNATKAAVKHFEQAQAEALKAGDRQAYANLVEDAKSKLASIQEKAAEDSEQTKQTQSALNEANKAVASAYSDRVQDAVKNIEVKRTAAASAQGTGIVEVSGQTTMSVDSQVHTEVRAS